MRGKFIVIEGLEGAGKSNAQRVVSETLAAHGIEFITTREPGGTPIAEALRNLWKEGKDGEHTTDKAEVLMIYAARTQRSAARIGRRAAAPGRSAAPERRGAKGVAVGLARWLLHKR